MANRLRVVILGLPVLFVCSALSQQAVDPEFVPSIDVPEYESGQGPRVLIDAVSESYDCAVSFASMHDDFETDSVRYSVFVRLNGKECTAALQELRSQGRVFRLSFGEMRTVDPEADGDSPRNLDLIDEVNPRTGN